MCRNMKQNSEIKLKTDLNNKIVSWRSSEETHDNAMFIPNIIKKNFYKIYKIKQKKNKERWIFNPINSTYTFQNSINESLLPLIDTLPKEVIGSVRTKSIQDNVGEYYYLPCIYATDIKTFFQSLKRPVIVKALMRRIEEFAYKSYKAITETMPDDIYTLAKGYLESIYRQSKNIIFWFVKEDKINGFCKRYNTYRVLNFMDYMALVVSAEISSAYKKQGKNNAQINAIINNVLSVDKNSIPLRKNISIILDKDVLNNVESCDVSDLKGSDTVASIVTIAKAYEKVFPNIKDMTLDKVREYTYGAFVLNLLGTFTTLKFDKNSAVLNNSKVRSIDLDLMNVFQGEFNPIIADLTVKDEYMKKVNLISKQGVRDIIKIIGESMEKHGAERIAVYKNIIKLFIDMVLTHKQSLPEGAATSPILANLVLTDIVTEIKSKIKSELSIMPKKMLSYLDDLSFGFSRPITVEEKKTLTKIVTAVLNKYGLKLNYKKTRVITGNFNKRLLGVTLNKYTGTNGQITIRPYRRLRREVRAMFYRIKKYVKAHIDWLKEKSEISMIPDEEYIKKNYPNGMGKGYHFQVHKDVRKLKGKLAWMYSLYTSGDGFSGTNNLMIKHTAELVELRQSLKQLSDLLYNRSAGLLNLDLNKYI